MPEENFWILWCKGRLTEADTPTIWLGATPSGLTSAHLHEKVRVEVILGRHPLLCGQHLSELERRLTMTVLDRLQLHLILLLFDLQVLL